MTEAKPATDSMLLEARNVRVEEWPCDCPTFDEEGSHLYLCPVILIPALLARIESEQQAEEIASLKAEVAALKDAAREYEHYVMTGRDEQHERLVAERDRLKAEVERLTRCQSCRGSGVVSVFGRVADCMSCHGTGRAR